MEKLKDSPAGASVYYDYELDTCTLEYYDYTLVYSQRRTELTHFSKLPYAFEKCTKTIKRK